MTMGYLEAGPDGQLKMTPACKSFIRGSAAKRVKRETAEVALYKIYGSCAAGKYNEDFLLKMTTVVVDGSYLGDAKCLGDLDLTIELGPRHQPLDFDALNRLYMEHFESTAHAICSPFANSTHNAPLRLLAAPDVTSAATSRPTPASTATARYGRRYLSSAATLNPRRRKTLAGLTHSLHTPQPAAAPPGD